MPVLTLQKNDSLILEVKCPNGETKVYRLRYEDSSSDLEAQELKSNRERRNTQKKGEHSKVL
jgi:hypothetical protein